MTKYRVVTPLARMHPKEGLQSFTHGDEIEVADKGEAARMIAAGIVEPLKGGREVIETADLKPIGLEKAVKTGPRKG